MPAGPAQRLRKAAVGLARRAIELFRTRERLAGLCKLLRSGERGRQAAPVLGLFGLWISLVDRHGVRVSAQLDQLVGKPSRAEPAEGVVAEQPACRVHEDIRLARAPGLFHPLPHLGLRSASCTGIGGLLGMPGK